MSPISGNRYSQFMMSRRARAATAAAAAPLLLPLLLLLLVGPAAAFLRMPAAPPLSVAAARSRIESRSSRWSSRRQSFSLRQPLPFQRAAPLLALQQGQEEGEEEEKDGGELEKLLEKDPRDTSVLAYLGFVSLALLGLGVATFKLGGQLLGLGFADDANFYWDSAPSYSLLLVYPPLFLVFPDARGLLLKTLVLSLVVTAGIWAFPYEAIGWEPTNEHILVTVAAPVLAYVTFFTWRATRTYLEIVAEEEAEAAEAAGKE